MTSRTGRDLRRFSGSADRCARAADGCRNSSSRRPIRRNDFKSAATWLRELAVAVGIPPLLSRSGEESGLASICEEKPATAQGWPERFLSLRLVSQEPHPIELQAWPKRVLALPSSINTLRRVVPGCAHRKPVAFPARPKSHWLDGTPIPCPGPYSA